MAQKANAMRFIRPDQHWSILLPSRREHLCLERLALKCGYRICEICAELDCSERYLYSVFTRDIGLPPKAWMRLERMVVACRMLVGGKPPEVVAADLGFASSANFRREFVRFYGVSPLKFQGERWRVGEV
jgi:AraC-like DNA-binding protein